MDQGAELRTRDISRQLGIVNQVSQNLKAKFGAMDVSEA